MVDDEEEFDDEEERADDFDPDPHELCEDCETYREGGSDITTCSHCAHYFCLDCIQPVDLKSKMAGTIWLCKECATDPKHKYRPRQTFNDF